MDLVDPRPASWSARAAVHVHAISTLLPQARIDHIGSTAIGGIRAKDVVDLLVGVPDGDWTAARERLSEAYVWEGARKGHAWLCWPDPQARRVIVHLVVVDDEEWRRRLTFRDALRADEQLAAEYEALKEHLASRTDDWSEYTQRKGDFVGRVLRDSR